MDKVEDIVGRLRAIAATKEDLDFARGRKAPLYGKESEIEWQAADLIQSQQALIEEMREALKGVEAISASQKNGRLYPDDVMGWEMAFDDAVDLSRKALSQKEQADDKAR